MLMIIKNNKITEDINMEFDTIDFAKWDTDKLDEYSKNMDTIFQYNEDIDKTAYLNWRMDFNTNSRKQFVVIGDAYFSSAYCLINKCLENNIDKKADAWIFPIMFNIVHGIEVYLKAINASLNIILGKSRTDIEGNHDIKQLCSTAKKLLIEYKSINGNSTKDDMFKAIKVVENFILNIYEKTDDMTFARYPMHKNKDGHFYIQALANEVIDLELIKEQIVYLYKMLEFIYDMPELEMELHAEIMYDMIDS